MGRQFRGSATSQVEPVRRVRSVYLSPETFGLFAALGDAGRIVQKYTNPD